LDLKAVVHGRKLLNAWQAAKGKMKGFCAETGANRAAGSGRMAAAALRRAQPVISSMFTAIS
jgi:hypothetical protein